MTLEQIRISSLPACADQMEGRIGKGWYSNIDALSSLLNREKWEKEADTEIKYQPS